MSLRTRTAGPDRGREGDIHTNATNHHHVYHPSFIGYRSRDLSTMCCQSMCAELHFFSAPRELAGRYTMPASWCAGEASALPSPSRAPPRPETSSRPAGRHALQHLAPRHSQKQLSQAATARHPRDHQSRRGHYVPGRFFFSRNKLLTQKNINASSAKQRRRHAPGTSKRKCASSGHAATAIPLWDELRIWDPASGGLASLPASCPPSPPPLPDCPPPPSSPTPKSPSPTPSPPVSRPWSWFPPLPLCGAYPFVGYCGSFLNKRPLPKNTEMVRAAQASPDHGFCGVSARAGDPSCLELR